jgi:F0F1-type ATP synthase membrane subunit b/b'
MGELLRELLQETGARPIAFVAEVIQSVLLIAVAIWAGRKYGARRLAERRERIVAELAAATSAEQESLKLRDEALAVAANATTAGASLVRISQENATREREASKADIDAAARQIVDTARSTLEAERDQIRHDAADRLVRLTSEIARRYVDEFLSESERRALTRKAIEATLDQLTLAAASPKRVE